MTGKTLNLYLLTLVLVGVISSCRTTPESSSEDKALSSAYTNDTDDSNNADPDLISTCEGIDRQGEWSWTGTRGPLKHYKLYIKYGGSNLENPFFSGELYLAPPTTRQTEEFSADETRRKLEGWLSKKNDTTHFFLKGNLPDSEGNLMGGEVLHLSYPTNQPSAKVTGTWTRRHGINRAIQNEDGVSGIIDLKCTPLIFSFSPRWAPMAP